MTLLGIIPARGGSQGVPLKNLQPVDGLPLVIHAAKALTPACDRVVVSTDHPHIAAAAMLHGFEVHERSPQGAADDATVADVAIEVAADLRWNGPVVLLQPTVYPPPDVAGWLDEVDAAPLDGQHPVVASVSTTHQHWHNGQVLLPRTNRQHQGDTLQREIGLYYWPAGRVGGSPLHSLAVPAPTRGQLVDIDTPADLAAARTLGRRKRVLFVYDENEQIGSGHRRRCETLAAAMPHHDVDVRPYTRDVPRSADVIVTDWLDTADRIPWAYAPLWVAVEDFSPATHRADAVVNSLYPSGLGHRREYVGPDWHVLRPEFVGAPDYQVRVQANRVLVMFGGTDPAGMCKRVVDVLAGGFVLGNSTVTNFDVTVVPPGADAPVAALMHTHDLLVTSAGRTVYEAAAIGIPAYVLPVNLREATHTHLGPGHGNLVAGMAELTPDETIRRDVRLLLENYELRRDMSLAGRRAVDGRGVQRFVWLVDGLLEGVLT